jgi:hypothetical protein
MTSTTSTLFVAGITAVLLSNISLASAKPSASFHDILLPTPNVTGGPAGEIKCYALPFGAVGIISHLLTDWTIAWMVVGKAPLWPGHYMHSYLFDMFLAGLSLCTCVPIASITIHRCRLSWHFVLICIWKLVTSISLACVTLHRCLIIRTEEKQKKQETQRQNNFELPCRHQYQLVTNPAYHNGMYSQAGNPFHDSQGEVNKSNQSNKKTQAPLWWLILYLAGTIVGMVGLCSLLYSTFRHDPTIRKLTYAFGGTITIIPICVAIYWYNHHLQKSKGGRKAYQKAFWQVLGGSVIAFTVVFGFSHRSIAIWSLAQLPTISLDCLRMTLRRFTGLGLLRRDCRFCLSKLLLLLHVSCFFMERYYSSCPAYPFITYMYHSFVTIHRHF